MLLSIKNLKHYVADRLLLDIDHHQVTDNEKIALIGRNGCGKSTLLKLIAGQLEPDQGQITVHGRVGLVSQLAPPTDNASGGEAAWARLEEALAQAPALLLADEPDSHLDSRSRIQLTKKLSNFDGAVILVTHDRGLINKVCQRIIEIDHGRLKLFSGNFDDYLAQKELELKAADDLYQNLQKEKKRLKKAASSAADKSRQVRSAPRRMGNSEARLHKMGDQRAKANLDKTASQIRTRLEKLPHAAKVVKHDKIKINLAGVCQPVQPILIESHNLAFGYPGRPLFNSMSFSLKNGLKTALTGANGHGKTTLVNLIKNKYTAINFAAGLRPGFLEQHQEGLDLSASILKNIMAVSVHPEPLVRTVLAQLLFIKDDVHKICGALSGGERVRAELARLMLGPFNLLILDEPTNFMDVESVMAVEEALRAYQGPVLLISHDQNLVKAVADEVWALNNGELKVIAPEDYC